MALKISHELADMRRHLWVQAPLRVMVDGTEYRAAEWSLGGVAIDSGDVQLSAAGQPVAVQINLPFQGFNISFDAAGEIDSWNAETHRSIIGFRNLGQRESELLSHFIEQLVRGNMTTVNETIQRLDAPLAAAEFAAAAPGNVPAPSSPGRGWRPARTAGMTMAYGIAGIAALGYLGSLLYTNLFWLEAQTSTISAPVETLASLGDGVVTWTEFKPGDPVKAGDVVLRIADNTLEREIEQAEITVRDRENKLAFLARRFENEKKRLGALSGLSSLKNAQSSAEIEGLNAKLQAATRELKQLPSTAVGPLAQVRQRIVALKQGITIKELELSGRANLARESGGSIEFIGQTVVGDPDTLAAQIELAEADIAIASRRHQSYLNQRDRLALRAPFDGILRQLPHADSATVKKGDVAAVIERSAERGVTAYLRQDQLLRVQLGAEAIVHVPATRQTFRATVAEIDPVRSPQKDHGRYSNGHGAMPRSEDGMAAVRLTLSGPTRPVDTSIYRDGLPAVTMIGLSRVPKAWTAPAQTRVGQVQLPGTPQPSQYADATPVTIASDISPAAAENAAAKASWLSRNLGDAWNYWVRASRPPAGRGG